MIQVTEVEHDSYDTFEEQTYSLTYICVVTEVEHDSYDTFEEQTYSLTYICVETAVTRRLGNGTTTSPSNPTSLLGT